MARAPGDIGYALAPDEIMRALREAREKMLKRARELGSKRITRP